MKLNMQQVADSLGCSRHYVFRRAQALNIGERSGRCRFFTEKEVQQIIDFPTGENIGKRGSDYKPRKRRPALIENSVHDEIIKLLRQGVGKRSIAKRLGVGVKTVQVRSHLVGR